jgi:hypothetical protein
MQATIPARRREPGLGGFTKKPGDYDDPLDPCGTLPLERFAASVVPLRALRDMVPSSSRHRAIIEQCLMFRASDIDLVAELERILASRFRFDVATPHRTQHT